MWTSIPRRRNIPAIMASDRVQRQIGRLLDEAEQAITNEDWPKVASRARAVLRLDSENSSKVRFPWSGPSNLKSDLILLGLRLARVQNPPSMQNAPGGSGYPIRANGIPIRDRQPAYPITEPDIPSGRSDRHYYSPFPTLCSASTFPCDTPSSLYSVYVTLISSKLFPTETVGTPTSSILPDTW